jgi:hypothetical protein
MKKLLFGAAMAALVGWSGAATANVVSATSAAFTINDLVTKASTGGPADLVGAVTFSNFVFTPVAANNTVTFMMTMNIANTTSSLFPSARLTAVGFNVDPNATGVTDNSGVFNAYLNQTFPSFNTVDVCSSTGNTCAGGGGGDLAPGGHNQFLLTLTGLTHGTTSIDLGANSQSAPELFDFKWQTGIGSFESQCTYGAACGPVHAPEPVSIALLGSALIGLGAVKRSKR